MSEYIVKSVQLRHVVKDGKNIVKSDVYRRGDKVELTDAEAKRFLKVGAIVRVSAPSASSQTATNSGGASGGTKPSESSTSTSASSSAAPGAPPKAPRPKA